MIRKISILLTLILIIATFTNVSGNLLSNSFIEHNEREIAESYGRDKELNKEFTRPIDLLLSRVNSDLFTLIITRLSCLNKNEVLRKRVYNDFMNNENISTQPVISNHVATPLSGPGDYPPIWNTPINTGTVHGFILMLESNPRINDIPLQPGDWIGGFYLDDNGERKCGGARMWNGSVNVMLTLFGNDGYTPEKDGFSGGELVEFRFFSWTTQKDYIVKDMQYHVELGWASNGRWYPTSLSKVLDMKALVDFDAYQTITPNIICLGDSAQLQAYIFIESTGTYTYSWSSDPPGFTSNLQNPSPVSPDVTTMYLLNVSDGIRYSIHQLPLIVHVNPVVSAGDDAIICENMNHQLQGSAENYSELLWSTSGDGSFSNPSILNPVYTPGVADKESGEVTLSITAIPLSPCSIAATNSMILSLSPLPSVDAGEDFSVCTNEPATLYAEAFDYSSVLWTTSGSGTFSDPHSLESIYYPSTTDVNNGQVTLTITASAVSPCTPPVSDTVSVSFILGPNVAAPNIIRFCEDEVVSITCYPSFYSSILWTTPGDGYFEDPTATSTTYHPGIEDINNAGVLVTIYAFAQDPCSMPASKDVELVIVNLPTVDAGGNKVMNADDNYITLEGYAENYSALTWSTFGDGFFTSLTNINTKYYPGANDRNNGEVILVLTASPLTYCSTPVSDEFTLEIKEEQSISIPLQAGWNLISFPLQPEDMSMISIVQPLIDQNILEIMQDEATGIIWPSYNIDTIGEMQMDKGYKIKVTEDTMLDMTGFAVSNPFTISLLSGWNIMSYPLMQSQNALDVLQPLIDLEILDSVKDTNNMMIYYDGSSWVNQIGDFSFGSAYHIKVYSDVSFAISNP
jgi:hypothetical protein